MAVSNIVNMNGRTWAQESNAAGSISYGLDYLGSVATTFDGSGNKQNGYRFHPYGTQQSVTGAGPTPLFKWVGGLGYRQTGRSYADYYVRARHYGSYQGAWSSGDPLWPKQSLFVYASANPVTRTDPSGLYSCWWCVGLAPSPVLWLCLRFCDHGRKPVSPVRPPGGGGGGGGVSGTCPEGSMEGGDCTLACQMVRRQQEPEGESWESECTTCCGAVAPVGPEGYNICVHDYCERSSPPFELPCNCKVGGLAMLHLPIFEKSV